MERRPLRACFGLITALAFAALAGCAGRPINEPIAQVDPQAGYRPHLRLLNRQKAELIKKM